MPKRMNGRARPLRGHSMAFKDYDDDTEVQTSMVGFLQDLWQGAPKDSFLFVASSDPQGRRWRDRAVRANDTTVGLNTFFHDHSRWDFNLYFCPTPFSEPRRLAKFALPTRLAWCDMDESRAADYEPSPSLCWRTSPGRYQGVWIWNHRHEVDEAEQYSKTLAYSFGGDRNGWSATKMLRIPGSINHKREYDEPYVKLVERDWRPISERPQLVGRPSRAHFDDTVEIAHEGISASRVARKYHDKLKFHIRLLLRDKKVIGADRSARIYEIIEGLWSAGASPEEIAAAVWASPYFISKHGRSEDRLQAEVSRVLDKLEAQS